VNIGEPKSDENSFQVSPSILARLAERPRARMGMTPCLLFGSLILDFFIFFSFFFASALQKFRFSGFPRVQPPTLVCTEFTSEEKALRFPRVQPPTLVCTEFTSEEKALRRVRRENQRLIRVIAGISWI